MRLFAAVLPPPAAVDELARAVARLRALPGAEALRWTDREGWHLTLAFYGETAEEELPALSAGLALAAAGEADFPLALRGGGRFGSRALWAGVAGDLTALGRLAERSRAAASGDADRTYRPHLTLARGRGPADLAPYVSVLDAFEGTGWRAGELALVRSNLGGGPDGAGPPRYEKVAGWALRGAG
ncbi:RNA 2',3'-cyclic phosphodiesterase [Streptomyces physcomitrii]|uniref:RNA 2',3'-cyclic phosphodiesterase n=1 Tax=Streptomyces physcomitrii TaxID=2724184 RepID=UPI0033F84644